jgi:hypothetical protein
MANMNTNASMPGISPLASSQLSHPNPAYSTRPGRPSTVTEKLLQDTQPSLSFGILKLLVKYKLV